MFFFKAKRDHVIAKLLQFIMSIAKENVLKR